jgi:hypothetical protein
MMRLAQTRGDVTPEQRAAILEQAQSVLAMEGALDHKLTIADFAARRAKSSVTVVDVLSQLFSERLDEVEQRQLLAMLHAVAAVHQGPTDQQGEFLARLATKLGIG